MSEATGEFIFSSNIEQVRQQIAEGLRGITGDLTSASSTGGSADVGREFLDSFTRNLSTQGARLLQQAEDLARDIQNKLRTGTGAIGLPQGGFTGQLAGGLGGIQEQVDKLVRDAVGNLPDTVKSNPQAQDIIIRAIQHLYEQVAQRVAGLGTEVGTSARAAGVAPSAAVGQGSGLADFERFLGGLSAELRSEFSSFGLDIRQFQEAGREVAERIRAAAGQPGGAGRLSTQDEITARQGATGVGPLASAVTASPSGTLAVEVAPGSFVAVEGNIVHGFEESRPIVAAIFNEAAEVLAEKVRAAARTPQTEGRRILEEREAGTITAVPGRTNTFINPETRAVSALDSKGDARELTDNQTLDARYRYDQAQAASAGKLAAQLEASVARAIENEEKANAAENKRIGAEVRAAIAAEAKANKAEESAAKKAATEEAAQRAQDEALLNARRRVAASADVASGNGLAAGRATFSSQGVTETGTGKIITDFQQLRGASEALSKKLEELAAAEEHAAKTPLDGLVQGLFGAGGRKRTGGAQAVDEQSPLFGLFETAGVVAKYEVLGRGIAQLGGAATGAVKDFSQLDEATSVLNEIFGSSVSNTSSFISNLENVAAASGLATDALVKSAAQAGAAFGGDTGAGRQQAATDAAPAITQAAVITGQDPAAATADLVAVGNAYQLTATQLTSVTSAVANARSAFGGDALQIQKGLGALADVGHQAGFSLEELATVVGKVQASTTDGGTQIAGSLTRIFATLQNKSTRTNLAQTLGLDLSGSVKNQIEQLAAAFPTLNASQRGFLESTVGGAKGLRDLLPLLQDQPALQAAYAKSLENSNAGQRAADASINSLAGQFRSFGATLKNLGLDLAKSGLLDPLILLFEAARPVVTVLDQLVQGFLNVTNVLGPLADPFRGFIVLLGEGLIALNAFRTLAEKGIVSKISGGIGGDARKLIAGEKGLDSEGNPVVRQRGLLSNPFRPAVTEVDANAVGIKAAQAEYDTAIREGAAKVRAAGTQLADAELAAGRESEAAIQAARAEAEVRAQVTAEIQAAGVALAEALSATALAAQGAAAADTEKAAASTANAGATDAEAASKLGNTAATEVNSAAKTTNTVTTELSTREQLLNAAAVAFDSAAMRAQGALSLALNPVTLAFGAALFAAYKLFEGEEARLKAFDKNQESVDKSLGAERASTSSSDDLRKQADDLRTSSNNIAKSSAGFFGTIGGALSEVFGGQNRGAARGFDERLAREDQRAAGALDDARNTASAGVGAFDVTQVEGVATGFKTLAKDGATAQQQLDALNAALGQVAAAANGAGRALLPGQAGALAAKAGDSITKGIFEAVDLASQQRKVRSGFIGGIEDFGSFLNSPKGDFGRTDSSRAAAALKKSINVSKLGGELQDDTAQAIKDSGLDQGEITKEKTATAVALLQGNLKGRLAEQGKDFAKLPKDIQEALLASVNEGLQTSLAAVTGGRDGKITKDNLDAVLASAPAVAQKAGADAATDASLSGNVNGGALVGATTALQNLQTTRANLAAIGTGNDKLADLDQKIRKANLDVQNAAEQHTAALASLATSLVSPFNKSGLIASQIAGINAQIDAAKANGSLDADKQAAFDTTKNNLANQGRAQAVADTASAARALIDPRAVVGNAQQDLNDARAKLTAVTSRPDSSGQDLTDARRAVTDAQIKLSQATVDNANTLAQAAVPIGDKVGEAFAQAAALFNSASAQIGAQRAATLRQANAAQAAAGILSVQTAVAVDTRNTDPRGAVQNAKDKLDLDQSTLAATPIADVGAAAALTKQIAADRIAVTQANLDVAKSQRDASVDPRDTVGQARVALADAKAAFANLLPGTAAYTAGQKALRDVTVAYATAQVELTNALRNAAIDPRDTVAVANNAVADATRTLTTQLRGTKGYAEAQAKLRDAILADAVTKTELANVIREASVFPGDALGAAATAVRDATASLKNDRPGTLKYYQDLKALRDAQVAYARAIEDQANTIERLSSDQTNPVVQAQNTLDAARRKLANDRKLNAPADVLAKDQLDVTAAQNSEQKTAFGQQLADAQTNLQLHRISGAAYLRYLETLRGNILATGLKTRQQLDELNQVDQAIQSANQQLQGQFNLGDIKVPTVFQERQQAALGGINITGTDQLAPLGSATNPLTGAATQVIQPLSDAIGAIQTAGAISQLDALQKKINGLATIGIANSPLQAAQALVATDAARLSSDQRHHASPSQIAADRAALASAQQSLQSVTNTVTINGADISKVITYLNSLLGRQAVQSRPPLTGKKV